MKTPGATGYVSNISKKAWEILTAVSMTVGRGPAARTVAGLAGLTANDRVVDVGCGPGTAVREAARRGATATGVDPSPVMLRLARWITAVRTVSSVTWVQATAESLPLVDGDATVLWALSSVHHWGDRAPGLAEARRVLARGGRILLAERLVQPGAHGHAAHGLTRDQADQLALDLQGAGFGDVQCDTIAAGRRTLVIVGGVRLP